jgi:putative acetyltransferase
LIVRPEQEEDRIAIDELHRLVFGGNVEAELVDRLRRERRVELSLVTIIGGQIVGHILFSDLEAEIDGRSVKALALAPMAVVPVRQRQGIGTRLMRESLARLKRGQYEAVMVLGHETYYPRFGFSAELARKLASPFEGDAFMAMELKPGALEGEQGSVVYPPAFALEQPRDS